MGAHSCSLYERVSRGGGSGEGGTHRIKRPALSPQITSGEAGGPEAERGGLWSRVTRRGTGLGLDDPREALSMVAWVSWVCPVVSLSMSASVLSLCVSQ